jgi:hypothetical protein
MAQSVLQLRGVRPFLSDKYDITKHKNYRFLSDFDPANAFNIGRFVSTRFKVDPNEPYTICEYTPPDEDIPDEAFGDYEPDSEIDIDPGDVEKYPEDLEPI